MPETRSVVTSGSRYLNILLYDIKYIIDGSQLNLRTNKWLTTLGTTLTSWLAYKNTSSIHHYVELKYE